MGQYWHSVTLNKEKCKGCTNCIKLCPTQAIRVQGGKAKIIKERCIDCGECIRVCPYHAKKAVTDSFDLLKEYKYKVALVAPAFYGQFSKADDINLILTALINIGFDATFEVARGAQAVSEKTRELLKTGELLTPSISSACPAVVRLIAVRFPNLIGNLIPLRSPMEISAGEARKEAMEKTGLKGTDIGIFFISPCAAKATSVKSQLTVSKSEVDGVLSIKDIYLNLAHNMGRIDKVLDVSEAGKEGILWATSGGEATASRAERQISVDGIHNVIKVLEDIEDGKLDDIEYVEALSCTGGCVGGPLTVENNFVARSRIQRICNELPNEKKGIEGDKNSFWDKPIVYRPVMHLDEDIAVAMEKAKLLEEINNKLPNLDCGSCGAPSCHALAEDIVRGFAKESDCIFRLRERVRELTQEMIDLETPRSISNDNDGEEKNDESFRDS